MRYGSLARILSISSAEYARSECDRKLPCIAVARLKAAKACSSSASSTQTRSYLPIVHRLAYQPQGAFDNPKDDAGVPHCVWRRCRHESLPSCLARVLCVRLPPSSPKYMGPRCSAHPFKRVVLRNGSSERPLSESPRCSTASRLGGLVVGVAARLHLAERIVRR